MLLPHIASKGYNGQRGAGQGTAYPRYVQSLVSSWLIRATVGESNLKEIRTYGTLLFFPLPSGEEKPIDDAGFPRIAIAS